MTDFSNDYFTNLAAELTANFIGFLASGVRKRLVGDEMTQALERVSKAGIVAVVGLVSSSEPEQQHLLQDIFRDFFGNEDVAFQVGMLLRTGELDIEAMAQLFDEAGFDATTLSIDFEAGMQAFEAAFLIAAVEEPELSHILNAQMLLEQTRLQQALLTEMRELVAALNQQRGADVAVEGGKVLANGAPVYKFSVQVDGDVDGPMVVGNQNTVIQDSVVTWVVNQYVTRHSDEKRHAEEHQRQLAAYLKWVRDDRHTVSMRAISSGKTSGEEQPPELAAVYVALNTTSFILNQGKIKVLSVLNLLASERKMVLLGDPGSGKSTFVNHLAYCLAAHGLEPEQGWLDKLNGWPEADADVLPVQVVLRDFARWLPEPLPAQADSRHVWEFIASTLERQKLEKAIPLVELALEQGRGLLLFDGLDEVTEQDQRRFVRDAVEAFMGRYDQNMMLVTCRILSYREPDAEKEEEDLRLDAKYKAHTLAEFDGEQRDAFVNAWYRELKRKGHLPGQDETLLIRDLQRATRRPDLWRVAGNPLLLTVMAMVHVEEGELPDSRAMLYDKTIDLLLSRWEAIKNPDETPRLKQLLQEAGRTDADLKARLAEVAFVVHTQTGSPTDKQQKVADISESFLCEELSKLNRKQLGWGQDLLGVIKERAGLLLEKSPGQFAFPHRTFQEYLAGVYLASQPDFSVQSLEWGNRDVGWWEMVLFGVEYLVYVQSRPLDVLPLVEKLCPKKEPESLADWRRVWLAGRVLEGLGKQRAQDTEWGETLLERVQQRLGNLLDEGQLAVRERASAGRTLAQLGDPRPGVGTYIRMSDGVRLPDIVWGKTVPAGNYFVRDESASYLYEKQRSVAIEEPYQLAKYPVTVAQFACFVDAGDFDCEKWWEGMPDNAMKVKEPAFSFDNHPRERVSWYQAMAFCRWLNDKLNDGTQINLPHEDQWEVAARYNDGRAYPWAGEFDPVKANTTEGESVGQTSAVGMYPLGKQPNVDLYDLSGNVWEWCRNKNDDRQMEEVDSSDDSRVLRGGSWYFLDHHALASSRGNYFPYVRNLNDGFRLCRVVAHLDPS